MSWVEAQKWETDWWGDCVNTYGEEEKQLLYANRMGLQMFHNKKSPYNINLGRTSVIDIGGGPVSLLLKCVNGSGLIVVEPMVMPGWVTERYAEASIVVRQGPGEELSPDEFDQIDEAWIYNVLQHTQDPERVIENARKIAKIVRLFEWIDTPANVGHPHSLSQAKLDEWLGGFGKVEELTGQANCFGNCYYGIFVGSG
jgi:hypothetical protein